MRTECSGSWNVPAIRCGGNECCSTCPPMTILDSPQHPAIIEAMREALLTEGAGSGASRLVTGNRPPYGILKKRWPIGRTVKRRLFLQMAIWLIPVSLARLVGRGDVVFSDQLNHASIVDGIVLSRAEHARYRHNDMEHLRALLHKYRDKRRKLIVTDAVFSMDGDQALLHELVALKHEYGAMLMVDEAHSGGIYGKRGEGLCHELGLQNDVDIHMGTFSKSFGVYGAYVCGSRTLIRWLVNKARPLIYSTALPPSIVAGISKALVVGTRQNTGGVKGFMRQASCFGPCFANPVLMSVAEILRLYR